MNVISCARRLKSLTCDLHHIQSSKALSVRQRSLTAQDYKHKMTNCVSSPVCVCFQTPATISVRGGFQTVKRRIFSEVCTFIGRKERAAIIHSDSTALMSKRGEIGNLKKKKKQHFSPLLLQSLFGCLRKAFKAISGTDSEDASSIKIFTSGLKDS